MQIGLGAASIAVVLWSAGSSHAGVTFDPADPVALAARAGSIVAADLDGNDHADLVVVSPEGAQMIVLLGDEASSTRLGPPVAISFGRNLRRLAVGDLDGDGAADVAVADEGVAGVWILLGQGDGTFRPPSLVRVGARPVAVAIADFDAVRNNDLAVADREADRVFILSNGGQSPPQFSVATEHRIGDGPEAVVAADLNRDQRPDVAALNLGGAGSKDVGVLIFERLVAGAPVFQPLRSFTAGERPSALAAADLNGDGVTDLALLDRPAAAGNSFLHVLLGGGDGAFLDPERREIVCPFFTGGRSCPAAALTAADLDEDETVDLAVVLADPRPFSIGDGLQILTGRGDGGFVAGATLTVGTSPAAIAAGDVNGDGPVDLAVATGSASALRVLVNTSTPGDAAPGTPCLLGEECRSGRCTNRRCCAALCFAFERCDVPDMEGTCVPINRRDACSDDDDCTGVCHDQPSLECSDAADCGDGDRCVRRACRSGFCCDAACSTQEDRCDAPGFEGICIPKSETGATCVEDADCLTNFCRDGSCCNESCENGRCNLPGFAGVCRGNLPLGSFCGDALGEPDPGRCRSGICDLLDLICCDAVCGPAELCDETGVCQSIPTPTPTRTATATPTVTPTPACPGDCDSSGGVGAAEVVRAVRIGLGIERREACVALDADADGTVRIDEIIAAVRFAMEGCRAA